MTEYRYRATLDTPRRLRQAYERGLITEGERYRLMGMYCVNSRRRFGWAGWLKFVMEVGR